MILDRIEQADLYTSLNPHFAKAFAFLRQEGLDKLKEGRHDIDGDGLYALVVRGTCKPPTQANLELHRNYIDVQYLISGCDDIGWKNSQLCKTSEAAYNPETDAALFSDTPSVWLTLSPGDFAIFFPEDAPFCSPATLSIVDFSQFSLSNKSL